MTDAFGPALVPEFLVADLERSLAFWVGRCRFEIKYSRHEERFAYIALGTAHVMLEQAEVGRNWVTGPLDRPLGRGMNLQIAVDDSAALAADLLAAGVDLFMQPESKWYRVGDDMEVGVRQFLVQDPDGYLVRFQSSLGRRAAER